MCVCVCVCIDTYIYFFNNSLMSLSGIVSSSENALCKQGKWRIFALKLSASTSLSSCKGFPKKDEDKSLVLEVIC